MDAPVRISTRYVALRKGQRVEKGNIWSNNKEGKDRKEGTNTTGGRIAAKSSSRCRRCRTGILFLGDRSCGCGESFLFLVCRPDGDADEFVGEGPAREDDVGGVGRVDCGCEVGALLGEGACWR